MNWDFASIEREIYDLVNEDESESEEFVESSKVNCFHIMKISGIWWIDFNSI